MKNIKRFDVEGKVFYCDDYVNTDVMAPGRFDPIYENEKLAKIALIDYQGEEPFVDPNLGRSPFSFIVAGKDFGCGSSRETAPMAIVAAGVNVIIAKSFARIFFRNCINMGEILPLAIDHSFTSKDHGKQAILDWESGRFILGDQELKIPKLGVVGEILDQGGLGKFVTNGGFSR